MRSLHHAGRIASGRVRVGDRIQVLQHPAAAAAAAADGKAAGAAAGGGPKDLRVQRIEKRAGLGKVVLSEAVAGDIVSLAGAGDAAGIADTIAAPAVAAALNPGPIDPPTLAMVFSANDSPLAGRAGKAVTGRIIGQRLAQEAETSVSLRVRVVPGVLAYAL
jgi:GTP-binding protein